MYVSLLFTHIYVIHSIFCSILFWLYWERIVTLFLRFKRVHDKITPKDMCHTAYLENILFLSSNISTCFAVIAFQCVLNFEQKQTSGMT